ncbi:hypothetical protein [Micromonospora globbae]|uniref:hypothetical protein n=1 Tax=Micromonospora globbae TaxID=1894969 RepID=UPI0034375214
MIRVGSLRFVIAPPLASRSWRLRAAVAVAVILASCLAVPVGWAAIKTAEAGKGEPTPIAAANAYLLATFAWGGDGLGVDRCLCDSRRAELLEEAEQMRRQLASAGPGVKVESAGWKTIDSTGLVSAQVSFVFTEVDAVSGRTLFYKGTAHEWKFHTKQERGIDGGWKVCRVDAPPICGTHIRC